VDAICGPTHDEQKPFRWDSDPLWMAVPHEGCPAVYNFSWVEFVPQ
jgi:hypothetical protein